MLCNSSAEVAATTQRFRYSKTKLEKKLKQEMRFWLKLEACLEEGEILWEEPRCRIAIQIISFQAKVSGNV